ncbi:hypothetical protein V7R84_01430 [Arachnia propionica]|uniref:hypothetical protein n=1 Tax=Arachnia propionica TaxID=1750 RepID=UPI0030CE0598
MAGNHDSLLQALWALAQDARWFSGRSRGGVPRQVELTDWFRPPGNDGPGLRSALLEVEYPAGGTEKYHVPLAFHTAGDCPTRPLAQVNLEGTNFDVAEVADEPAAMTALLDCLASGAPGFIASREVPSGLPGHRYRGEQSNTSMFFGDLIVGKIFRRIENGPNTDVEMHQALSGSGAVAELFGWWEWQGAHLGVFLEALPDPHDGFVEACRAAETRTSFDGQARDLGRQLTLVHGLLASRFPTGRLLGQKLAAQFRARLEAAVLEVPLLERFRSPALRTYRTIEELELPTQRIHGDCHLGQALSTRNGWRYVDFEGEPIKSLQERREPDSPLRDVAGMLRSFDYAAASGDAPEGWRDEARAAFLDGYSASAEIPVDVLLAYEVDKAIYEVVYETRNRPTFTHIPVDYLAGIES